MKYIIMCGGKYKYWKTPKQLQEVYGQPIVQWTIWYLFDAGVHPHDIFISSNDSRFDGFGVERLKHNNTFETDGKKMKGYWVDGFYPMDEPVTYLYGDVLYTRKAIETIVNSKTNYVLMFGSFNLNRKDNLKEWEEPYGFKVVNTRVFKAGIEACKELKDEGLTKREPISWELYRLINGYPVNKHIIKDNYVPIDDLTTDFDTKEELKKFKEMYVKDEIYGPHFS